MNVEIAQYAAQVGAALADLPEQVRDDLIEDLPAHLAEVAAEIEAEGGGATLAQRLGPPSAYAAELRATLGHTGGPSRTTAWAGRLAGRVRNRWRVLDRRLGTPIGYERLGDFLALLRPAWWVLRGWLAAMLLALLWRGSGELGVLPRIEGSLLLGLLFLAGFVAASIWLGRRTAATGLPARRPVRLAHHAATLILAVFGVVLLFDADDRLSREYWSDTQPVGAYDPYGQVSDVFVIGPDGQVVPGARLVDQDGIPIVIGACARDRLHTFSMWNGNSQVQVFGWEWNVNYPACEGMGPPRLPWVADSPEPLPWGGLSPTATPQPAVSATPLPSTSAPLPSATAAPTPTP